MRKVREVLRLRHALSLPTATKLISRQSAVGKRRWICASTARASIAAG